VGYESPLRASLQGDEQNELARLRSKRKVRQALHSETIALVSWRYQLPQNGIRREALAKIRRHFIFLPPLYFRGYYEGASRVGKGHF
jgi:hypothetical protein